MRTQRLKSLSVCSYLIFEQHILARKGQPINVFA